MEYDYLVFIGRFEPFHNGHAAVARAALAKANKLIVLIGSADTPRTIKNPFTVAERAVMIQAALAAGSVGKGLGDTDIGRALLAGAAYFEARPYVGSRILLLISDGGARLDTGTRERIAAALKQHRIGVYWLYLVGRWGRRLVLDGSLDGPAHAQHVGLGCQLSAGRQNGRRLAKREQTRHVGKLDCLAHQPRLDQLEIRKREYDGRGERGGAGAPPGIGDIRAGHEPNLVRPDPVDQTEPAA